jgi:hypothetical protein
MNGYIKVIFLVCCMLIMLTGCAFSTKMVNEKGDTYTCMAPGIGPLSGMAAMAYRDNCVKKYKELGYKPVE